MGYFEFATEENVCNKKQQQQQQNKKQKTKTHTHTKKTKQNKTELHHFSLKGAWSDFLEWEFLFK